jgi:hypothetical protein
MCFECEPRGSRLCRRKPILSRGALKKERVEKVGRFPDIDNDKMGLIRAVLTRSTVDDCQSPWPPTQAAQARQEIAQRRRARPVAFSRTERGTASTVRRRSSHGRHAPASNAGSATWAWLDAPGLTGRVLHSAPRRPGRRGKGGPPTGKLTLAPDRRSISPAP